MPDHIEVETQDLQEKIQELDDEREEKREEDKRFEWIRYVGLSTAILAVFAAVGALQSGNLVNEALIHQLKASDTWNEYQAARQKDHVYTLAINGLVDARPNDPAMQAAMTRPVARPPSSQETAPQASPRPATVFAAKSADARAADYRSKVADEMAKEDSLSAQARDLENESEAEINKHHRFEYSVALIQVAIAVGAVAALTRVKPVWYLSLLAGLAGVVLFVVGFLL